MSGTEKLSSLPTKTSIDSGDYFIIHDTTAAKAKKVAEGTIASAFAPLGNGWQSLNQIPNTVTYNGNRSYSLVFNGVDLTGVVSNGMRLKTTRTVNAPTQCTSLNGSTQFYSKSSPAGMTFTDNWTQMAWVKLSAYQQGVICGRRTGNTSGFDIEVSSAGQFEIVGLNASSFRAGLTQQSLPLNKWVHVAATGTMSTNTFNLYIDGLLVPSASVTSGTPTTIVQSGDFVVGAQTTGSFPFAGKIEQEAVFNAVLSAATIRSYYSQGLAGNEPNLISAHSFNNSINDLNTTNANNLTPNGSAVATNVDAPLTQDDTGIPSGTTDFGIITSKVFSTNTTLTVRVPEGCTIPTSGGVSAVAYSTQASPYGFSDNMLKSCRRLVYIPVGAQQQTTSTTSVQFNPVTNYPFTVPSDCTMLRFGMSNASFSDSTSGATGVLKIYNGAINTVANELTQINATSQNGYLYFDIPVPAVRGESISLNVGWSCTSGTLTWTGGAANRQSPAIWVECA